MERGAERLAQTAAGLGGGLVRGERGGRGEVLLDRVEVVCHLHGRHYDIIMMSCQVTVMSTAVRSMSRAERRSRGLFGLRSAVRLVWSAGCPATPRGGSSCARCTRSSALRRAPRRSAAVAPGAARSARDEPEPSTRPRAPARQERARPLSTVDPPDLAVRPTLRRLFPLWWEQRRLVGARPRLRARLHGALARDPDADPAYAIDDAIAARIDDRLLPLPRRDRRCSATLRFVVELHAPLRDRARRHRVEARLRELLYDAYLRYPRAFYDRHATGQVISRATNDLYPVRYFIGWGIVQGIQSAMMIIGVGDRARARQPAARARSPRSRCRRRRAGVVLRAPRHPDLAPRAGARRAT